MNKTHLIFSLGIAGLLATATAQTQADKALTEKDLLKKMDALNTTAATRPRLGLEGTGLDEAKRAPTPKKARGVTTITAHERTTFDNKTREAVFIGKVVVEDPEFNLQCDRLDAFLKPEKAKPAPGQPQPPAAGAGADADKAQDKGSGGLDHAIADANPGSIVIITKDKIETDGSISKSIGKSRRATYESKTGDVVLTGMPSIQQGSDLCVATDESTVMTLNRDGRMKVEGPHKMVIKDTSSLEGK